VTNWRDSTTEHVQSDLDRLLNRVLPFADEMLVRHGEFFPYGAAITLDGEEQIFAADPGDAEDPSPAEVLTSIVDGISGEASGLRAVAVVSDVTNRRSDAIMVHLEHADELAIAVLLPYERGEEIEYGELVATPVEAKIWRRSLC
jgi:hypothetical protein